MHSAFNGPQDEDEFFAEMIGRRRLVIRLGLDRDGRSDAVPCRVRAAGWPGGDLATNAARRPASLPRLQAAMVTACQRVSM